MFIGSSNNRNALIKCGINSRLYTNFTNAYQYIRALTKPITITKYHTVTLA